MIVKESVRLPFRYAAGATASSFLRALRDEGRVLGALCPACGLVNCPARSLCPRCGARAEELVEAGPAGTLVAWTEVPGRGAYGLVRLDGADTALVHLLLGPAEAWHAGARVRARVAPERAGSILDIAGFEVTE